MTRKLSDTDVVKIKEMSNRLPMHKVGRLFGVGTTTVCRIINNQTYLKPQSKRYLPYNEPSVKSDVKTKRVYDLEVDDMFIYYGIKFRVIKIEDGQLFYKPTQFDESSAKHFFGVKCQMKVEYLGKRQMVKRKEHNDHPFYLTPHSKNKDYTPQVGLTPKSRRRVSKDVFFDNNKSSH